MHNEKEKFHNLWFFTLSVFLFWFSNISNIKAATSTEQLIITAEVSGTTTTATPPSSTTTPSNSGAGGQAAIILSQEPFSIIDVQVLEIGATRFKLKFMTNKNSLGELNYGFSYSLEKTIWDNTLQKDHIFTVDGLREDTLYYYQVVAKDNQGNRITSQIFNFRTTSAQDNEPPSNPSQFRAELRGMNIYLLWQNPTDNDFRNVILMKNSQKLYEGIDESFLDKNVTQGQTYLYTLFSADFKDNVSSGVILKVVIPQYKLMQEASYKPARQIGEGFKVSVKEADKLVFDSAFVDIKEEELKLELKPAQESTKFKELKTHYFPDQQVKITLNTKNFKKPVSQIIFSFANIEEHLFRYDKAKQSYIVDFKTPTISGGVFKIRLLITYQDGTTDAVNVGEILIDPYGYVYRKIIHQKIALFKKLTVLSLQERVEEMKVSGVKVSLYRKAQNKENFELWPAYNYDQKNPQLTNEKGEYGFLVPPGFYYLEAIDEDLNQKAKTETFEVFDRIVNKNIEIGIFYIYWFQDPENIVIIINILLLISLLITFLYLIYKRRLKSELTKDDIV